MLGLWNYWFRCVVDWIEKTPVQIIPVTVRPLWTCLKVVGEVIEYLVVIVFESSLS